MPSNLNLPQFQCAGHQKSSPAHSLLEFILKQAPTAKLQSTGLCYFAPQMGKSGKGSRFRNPETDRLGLILFGSPKAYRASELLLSLATAV